MMKKSVLILSLFALMSISALAGTIAAVDSLGAGALLPTNLYPVSTDNSWVTKWTITPGVLYASLGVSGNLGIPGSPATDQYSAVGWNVAGQYFSMVVNLAGGYRFGNDVELYYGGIRTSGTGPTTASTAIIVNGVETTLRTYTPTSTYGNYIDDLSGKIDGADSVEIRWYASGATASTGTYRIGDWYNGTYTDAGLYGTIGRDPNEPNEPNVPPVTYNYGWEDGIGDIVYSTGNVYKPQNTTEQFYTGSHALKVTKFPATSTSTKATFAWVKNLQTGDTVTAKVWAYIDASLGLDHKTRLVADYTSSDDITNNFGAMGTTSDYTQVDGWQQIECTWTVITSDIQDGLLVSAYLFSNTANASEDFIYDDFEITIPEHAEVVLPSAVMNPADYTTHTYGWENFDQFNPAFRETVLLGTDNSIQTGLEVSEVHSGTKALWISEDGTATGEGYVAWIKNLVPGDYIDVSGFAKSYAGSGEDVGVRMWTHYTYDDNNIDSYAGTADGFNVYSDPNSWLEFNKRWVFTSATYTDADDVVRTPTGVVIEIRTYKNPGDGGNVDDLSIEVPNTATVAFPSMIGNAICVGGKPQWDFNGDCIFNLLDLVLVIDDWLGCNLQPHEDCGI